MASRKPSAPSKQPAQSPKPSGNQHQPQATQAQLLQAQWSGPLPHPAALADFNNIIPNGADRIMAMVEQEQNHRIAHDTAALQAEIRDTRRGQWMGWTISMAALVGCLVSIAMKAHYSVSIALISLPIVAIIKAFLKRGA